MAVGVPAAPAKTAQNFYVTIPPPELAQDTALIEHLVQLINEVYTVAEAGIFDAHYLRTNTSEITKYITNGELALASNSPSSPWSPSENVQGCIRITRLSPTEGEIAMIVASAASRGTGLGKQLIAFAEEHCRAWGVQKARLDLVVPTTFRHELKSWIQPWYERLGYRMVGTTDLSKTYPKIAECIVTPTEYRMFEKVL